MKDRKQEHNSPKKEWARLYVDQSEASSQVIRLLRNSGFRVIAFPVNGTIGPELKLGRRVYRGLEEIKRVVEE